MGTQFFKSGIVSNKGTMLILLSPPDEIMPTCLNKVASSNKSETDCVFEIIAVVIAVSPYVCCAFAAAWSIAISESVSFE